MSDQDKPLDHEYDGIQEYDNPLPMWWQVTFYATIIFGFIYWIHYESGSAPTQIAELQADLQELEARRSLPAATPPNAEDEAALLGQMATSKEAIEKGQAVYSGKCLPCHGAKAEGGIGPNLTDNYWIHGKGQLPEIAQTIRQGISDKGMPAWEGMISAEQVREVAVFVASLHGSNPPNAKAPQGEMVGP